MRGATDEAPTQALLAAVLHVAADEFFRVLLEDVVDLVQYGVELGADLLPFRSEAAALLGGFAAVLCWSRRLALPRVFAHGLCLRFLNPSILTEVTRQIMCHEG